MNYLLSLLVAYLLGSIPTAFFVVLLFCGVDVRSGESGNMGALNTLRMVKKHKGLLLAFLAFLIVWVVDMTKAVLAVVIAQKLITNFTQAVTLGTFFAVLGHNYPIWLKGKGGRGAASLMGVMIFFNPLLFIWWIATIFLTSEIIEVFIRLFSRKKINVKMIAYAASEQILGRLIGEVIGIWVVYVVDRRLFYPVLLATFLIIIRHWTRFKKQFDLP